MCRLQAECSEWSVQDHLEHLLQVDQTILGWIRTVIDGTVVSDPPGRPTFPGYLVLTLGFIPRGRGRAPDGTLPEGRTRSELIDGYAGVADLAKELRGGLSNIAGHHSVRRHPLLGCFTARQWLTFADIHHRHHDKIIADIRSQP